MDVIVGLFVVILILIIAVLVITIIARFLIANEFYIIAKEKGYYDKKYLWIPFLAGTAGCLLINALPDRGNSVQTAAAELPEL